MYFASMVVGKVCVCFIRLPPMHDKSYVNDFSKTREFLSVTEAERMKLRELGLFSEMFKASK